MVQLRVGTAGLDSCGSSKTFKSFWLENKTEADLKFNLCATLFAMILPVAFTVSCRSTSDKNRYKPTEETKPLVDAKYSLAADRQQLEALRAEVPEEKKQVNDEEAFILQMFSEVKREPGQIRQTFDQLMRKKRELMDRDLKKERELFSRSEKTSRDDFLNSQSRERNRIKNKKLSRDEVKFFYDEQDQKRKDFYANEREKRQDFESQVFEKRKNFEDYARGKTNEFNAEFRAYQKNFDDQKKAKAQADKSAKAEAAKAAAGTKGQPAGTGPAGQ